MAGEEFHGVGAAGGGDRGPEEEGEEGVDG